MLMIRDNVKELIMEKAREFQLDEKTKKEIDEKRNYFLTHYSPENIARLDPYHYFQGRGMTEGNFTYDLEWNSTILGSIKGGSVYKFGYPEDFDRIKKLILKILSAENNISYFYKDDGDLTEFSLEIVKEAETIKGVSRSLVGKILAIYFPDIFITIYGLQDEILERIYENYKPQFPNGVELYFRNNYLLLQLKKKYAPHMTNDEFSHFLWKIYGLLKKKQKKIQTDEKIDALETQHYQTLIHRNFKILFRGKLKYYDPERQNEKYGRFDTQEVGEMDFLAVDEKNNFVVIEIKRHSTDKTVGQILRYMGWVKKNLCKNHQSVRGLIIAESKDNRLDYALIHVPNVKFKKMHLHVEIEGFE